MSVQETDPPAEGLCQGAVQALTCEAGESGGQRTWRDTPIATEVPPLPPPGDAVKVVTPPRIKRLLACSLALLVSASPMLAQVLERISVSSLGVEANGDSDRPDVSPDGRFVVFFSHATNLIPEPDLNGPKPDVFVRDRLTGETSRVDISSSGRQARGYAKLQCITADGRYVVFHSLAPNLVPDDTNRSGDVFLHDRLTGETTRVSVSSTGQEGNGHSGSCGISSDGRYVVFASAATNFSPGDLAGLGYDGCDVFVHDRRTHQTTCASLSRSGEHVPGRSLGPSITPDGRYVAFRSMAALVPEDTNGRPDVYVRDRSSGGIRLVSATGAGISGNDASRSWPHCMSDDGRSMVFASMADDLVSGDMNNSQDVFLHDFWTGKTRCLSVTRSGQAANGRSTDCAMSPDGRFVVYASDADDLAGAERSTAPASAADPASPAGAFLPLLGYLRLLAPAPACQPAAGRPVAWHQAPAGGPGEAADTTGTLEAGCCGCEGGPSEQGAQAQPRPFWIYVYDRLAGTTQLASYAADGSPPDGDCWNPTIARQGALVAFASTATNLAPGGDSSGYADIFMAAVPSLRPQLSWAGTRGYESDGVDPNTGRAGDTFSFKVKLTDPDGAEPGHVRLVLFRNGVRWRSCSPQAGSGSTAEGRVYSFTKALPAGAYSYLFLASCADLKAIGIPRRQQWGPIVTGEESVLLSTLAATPSPEGSQIIFTISRPAEVAARVVNAAGRTIAVICRAKGCSAGAQALVWNGQSSNGLRVPDGVYLVEVSARSADGSQARALTPIRLTGRSTRP